MVYCVVSPRYRRVYRTPRQVSRSHAWRRKHPRSPSQARSPACQSPASYSRRHARHASFSLAASRTPQASVFRGASYPLPASVSTLNSVARGVSCEAFCTLPVGVQWSFLALTCLASHSLPDGVPQRHPICHQAASHERCLVRCLLWARGGRLEQPAVGESRVYFFMRPAVSPALPGGVLYAVSCAPPGGISSLASCTPGLHRVHGVSSASQRRIIHATAHRHLPLPQLHCPLTACFLYVLSALGAVLRTPY